MLHAFRFAGGARGVQHEQRMLGADPHRLAGVGLPGLEFVHPAIVGLDRHLPAGAPVHDHMAHGFAAAEREGVLHRGHQRQRLATPELAVGRDDQGRTDVDDALLQRLRREPAEHHGVGQPEPRAGLHRDHRLDRHRHVDDRAFALGVAQRLQAVREAAHTGVQVLVGDRGDRAVVGLEQDRDLVLGRRAEVAIEAVVRDVQLAILEPAEERRLGIVQRLGERPLPQHLLAGQPGPEAGVVAFGLVAQCAVLVHARDGRLMDEGLGGREHAVLDEDRFDLCGHVKPPRLVGSRCEQRLQRGADGKGNGLPVAYAFRATLDRRRRPRRSVDARQTR